LNEIVIGLLLGDGHIQRRSLNGNSRFKYGQSSLRKHHYSYFNHVFDLFQPYLSEDFKIKERSFTDKRTKQKYCSVNFTTLSLPCFNLYRNLFYNSENIKIVPSNIQELLTPRGLAYWIMDDGSLQNKGLHLNTYNFTIEEVLNLKKTLENMFSFDIANKSLNCSIHKHSKGPRIYVWEESMGLIRDQISQFMHKDMLYKIDCSKIN
ncbi:Intron-encoded DNA endonuclease aI5 alpha, partial [Leucoagaricus sp. SymC.cos]